MKQPRILLNLVAAGALFISGGGIFCNNLLYAQTASSAPNAHTMHATPQHQINLSAQAQTEVASDWLTVVLAVQRDGPEPQALQTQVQKALDAALTQAKTHATGASKDGFEIRTGAFQTHPRYGSNGRINGWTGRAELVLQGRDLARITHAAAQLNTMVVQSLNFSLATDTRRQLETQLQTEAITRFRARAQHIAEAFGYRGYTLGHVDVGTLDGGQPMFLTTKAFAPSGMVDAAPIPAEPGTTLLQLTVSGMVMLQK